MFFSNHLTFLNHNGTKRSSILFQKCASYNKDNERDKTFDKLRQHYIAWPTLEPQILHVIMQHCCVIQ